MAIDHEPGCDREHTPRQRCNQNALFAEQGEVPAEMAAEERPAASAISAVSERPEPAPEVVEEIIAIREEVLIPEPAPEWAPAPRAAHQREEAQPADGYGMLVGLAATFAIVTMLLVALLRRRRDAD
jgi:hypothetical protein